MRRSSAVSLLVLACASVQAQTAPGTGTPITLAEAMADPDWIGHPVEAAWWRWDGQGIEYLQRRNASSVRDTWRIGIDGSSVPVLLDAGNRADIDGREPVYDAAGSRIAYIRNGDVFVRDLRSGALTQLTRTAAAESRPQWSREGVLSWKSGEDWYRWDGRLVGLAASVKAEDAPGKPPKADDLRDRQLRLIETLRRERERRDGLRAQEEAWRRADPSMAAAPAYLGKDVAIDDSSLSPDGRWLLVATHAKSGDEGQAGKMPKYVTESGYEEVEDVRTRVGRGDPLPQALWLVEVATGNVRELEFDALPGIATDPLADLRKAAGKDALKGERPLRLAEGRGGAGIAWGDDGRNVAVMLRAIDNKDRWIATVDLGNAKLQPRHRLTDPAWINWDFNGFGWLPGTSTLWFQSEESGYGHLYLSDGGKPRALTSGKWEASDVQLGRDGRSFWFLCNRSWPGDYEVCTVPAAGGAVREVTALDGVEGFALSPDGGKLLVRHSEPYVPAQLAVLDANGDGLRQLTDTRTPQFKARQWIAPRHVQVPSKHGAGTVWGKFYAPAQLEPGRKYPLVLFVHGAGYLQNVHDRYPNYFREQMFHNLLVQRGYLVLDLDFRASSGYGRDWRTAIYRHMGEPELQDYLDGIDWAVAQQQADRDRVGIYGGSYGGFMTFMALFKKPGVFKAGAALRPVTDWSQYNHGYTANILNTPELDPEAYLRSSPIELADGLQNHLLIAHGMIDDNVFYKDSVMLAQRLIELRKDKWELASYPLERHAYVHSDSWYDQYRRVLELFEKALK